MFSDVKDSIIFNEDNNYLTFEHIEIQLKLLNTSLQCLQIIFLKSLHFYSMIFLLLMFYTEKQIFN